MHPNTINNYDTPSTTNSLLLLPPQLLGRRRGLFLPGRSLDLAVVGQATGAVLGADDEHDVVTRPRLQGPYVRAILAGERLLEVDDIRLQVPEHMHVTAR